MDITEEMIADLLAVLRRGMAEWLSPGDASVFLGGIPVKTLEHWRRCGGGPRYSKVGRLVRYSREELHQFMNDRRVPP